MTPLIPKKLKVGGAVHKVEWVEDLHTGDGEKALGKWTTREPGQPIQLDATQRDHPDQAFVTLLHEALHIIEYELGLGLKEATVTALGHSLAALLIDNKLFE